MKKMNFEIALKLALITFVLFTFIIIAFYQSFYQSVNTMNVDKGLIQLDTYSRGFMDEMFHTELIVNIAKRHVELFQKENQRGSMLNIQELDDDFRYLLVQYVKGHHLLKSVSFFSNINTIENRQSLSYVIGIDGVISQAMTDDEILFQQAVDLYGSEENLLSFETEKWSSIISEGNNKSLFVYKILIKNEDANDFLIIAELDPIRALVEYGDKVASQGGNYILANEEDVIFNPKDFSLAKIEEFQIFVPNALESERNVVYQMDHEGEYVALLAPLYDDWMMVGLHTHKALNHYSNKIVFPWLLTVILMLIFVVFSMFLFATSMTGPLRQLTQAILEYDGVGNTFVMPAAIKQSKNELLILGNAIQGLIERISLYNEKVEFQNQVLINEAVEKEQVIKELSIASRIIDTSHEGVCIVDKDFNITYVNDKFEQITRYKRAQVVGLNISVLDPSGSQMSSDIYEELRSLSVWSGFIKQLKADGSLYDQKLTLRMVRSKTGEIANYVGTFTEFEDTPYLSEQQRQFDPLTGLMTKETFINEIKGLSMTKVHKDAMFLIGIDSFRAINQTMGHEVGDEILRRMTSRIINAVPYSNSLIARFSGDEFAVLIDNYNDERQLVEFAENILTITNEPFVFGEERLFITASIGICLYPKDAHTADELIKRVTSALHVAKKSGKKTYKFFSIDELETVNRHIKVMNLMHDGWQKKEFYLVYQPKMDLKTQKVVGAEALMRWKSSLLGDVSPVEFIPIAEELGLIKQMGAWCIDESASRVAEMLNGGMREFRISVNLSYYQLVDEDILTIVKDAISMNRIPPEAIELEITESILMTNMKRARSILSKLKAIGVYISVDDFGTGYSSLSYLKNLPIDILKIDRSFIKDIPEDDGTIAKIIIQLAHSLSMLVIAEGVETIEQIDFLIKNHCFIAQGYFYAKPLEFIDFLNYCMKQNRILIK